MFYRDRLYASKAASAFTLIELSIVLVIIGLIVGGVLTGQDLIQSAGIRATISQVGKYNTAVYTFRNKYGGIPGDLQETSAAAFNLAPVMSAASPVAGFGFGDGNGIVDSPSGINMPVGEVIAFWAQLSSAGLIDGAYGSDITTAGQAVLTTPASYLPTAKIGNGNYFLIGSGYNESYTGTPSGYMNYFGITGITSLTPGDKNTAAYTRALSISPVVAYGIDSKIDDGSPVLGRVRATKSNLADMFSQLSAPWWAATPTSGKCTTGGGNATDPASTYNMNTSSGGSVLSCTMTIRAGF